jgi:hypothetical protein
MKVREDKIKIDLKDNSLKDTSRIDLNSLKAQWQTLNTFICISIPLRTAGFFVT